MKLDIIEMFSRPRFVVFLRTFIIIFYIEEKLHRIFIKHSFRICGLPSSE